MDENLTLKLHDITPLVEVPDYSLYYFIALVLGGLIIGVLIGYLLWRYIKKERKNSKKVAYEQLRAQGFDDSKAMAYLLSETFETFKDNERIALQYHDLHQMMAKYKYQKEVPPISSEDRAQIELYLDLIEAEL